MQPNSQTEQSANPDVTPGCGTESCIRDFFSSNVPRLSLKSPVSEAVKELCLSDLMALPVTQNQDNSQPSLFKGEFRVRRLLREIFSMFNSENLSHAIEELLGLPVKSFVAQPAGVLNPADEPEKLLYMMAASESLMVNVVEEDMLIGVITCRSVLNWISGFALDTGTSTERQSCRSINAVVSQLFETPINRVIAKDGVSSETICLATEDDLFKALWISTGTGKDFLPVLRRNGQLAGILKTNNILSCLLPADSLDLSIGCRPVSAAGKIPVTDLIDLLPELISQDAPALEAVIRMHRSNQMCMGMVNASGEFCGLFSFHDLLNSLLTRSQS